jgi:hypothetical protein
LRGDRSDFGGLSVAGRLDLDGAHVPNLHFRWHEIATPLMRAQPTSAVLRPLHARLEQLKFDDDARDAWAELSDRRVDEMLKRGDVPATERARVRLERALWGWPTAYGTRLGRIAALSLAAWLCLSLPIVLWPRLRIGALRRFPDDAWPRHRPVPKTSLIHGAGEWWSSWIRRLAYSFGLMFAVPGFRLRPMEPVSQVLVAYFLVVRGVGAVLLALLVLTLANVSPVFQAILGKIVA